MKSLFAAVVLPLLLLTFLLTPANGQGTKLSPGFEATEYADLLWLAFYGITDSLKDQSLFMLNRGGYERKFRSAEVGLFNRCEIYLRSDSVIIVSLRGTVKQTESWLENFYAGMIPATGSLQLSDNYIFNYKLADRPDAMVHTGWTIGTGFLVKEYLPVLEQMLGTGLRQVIVTGHSQGGALSFLNTSFLHYYFKEQYPDLKLKTYASAAPKPGNLYYAYDFEHLTGDGFAYRVVNAYDWVPESPISVQGLSDINTVNPFAGAPETIAKQKWPDRLVMKHMYNKMRKGSSKAADRYQKYLGEGVGKLVKKSLPGYVPPVYSNGSHYITAGAPIILQPNEEYKKKFPDDPKNVFIHHMYAPYFFLLKSLYPF
jgi:hypothetical protein